MFRHTGDKIVIAILNNHLEQLLCMLAHRPVGTQLAGPGRRPDSIVRDSHRLQRTLERRDHAENAN